MIRAWRITQRMYEHVAFTGEGSKLFGGRWNSEGHSMVYLADTFALAQLELLANVPRDRLVDMNLVAARVEFDEHLVVGVSELNMPYDWHHSPWPASTQEMGDRWLQEKSSPVLCVPSVVSPPEFNYLLNPFHPDFHKITIHPFYSFSFDRRLLV